MDPVLRYQISNISHQWNAVSKLFADRFASQLRFQMISKVSTQSSHMLQTDKFNLPSCKFRRVGHRDRNLPTNESAKPCIGHLNVERQLRNPDAELDEPGVSTVLDNDRRRGRSTRLGAVEEHKSARFWHLQTHTHNSSVHPCRETTVASKYTVLSDVNKM